jgi:hypothetical protein|uniref:Uncharacterized protein n=1 Tax=viral metagenome TaxID=1070528 RepID=A0A6C0JGU7_9ZZZZ
MKLVKNLLKAEHRHSRLLELLLAIYIIVDVDTPRQLARMVDTTVGQIIIYLLIATMFYSAGPIAGVLSICAAYLLIDRSSKKTGSYYTNAESAEEIKMDILKNYNGFPKTLEEDIVNSMAPLVKHGSIGPSDYKPVLGKLHSASAINA